MRQLKPLRQEQVRSLSQSRDSQARGVFSTSNALVEALQRARIASPLDVTVLLTGASGTGKSLLARAIHDASPRANSAYVEINCAALPETLIESELFGSAAGGHSTAFEAIPGKILAAEGGTLLLDEIAELPLRAQAKLLQLLQSKTYYPLGSALESRADVRLIAATNADLSKAVSERRFRVDLFYRLQVLSIRLPSLSERRHDIAGLAGELIERAAEQHGLRGCRLSTAAITALESAEWPGNIRQLAHTLESALIVAAGEGASRIERRHLPTDVALSPPESLDTESFQAATRRFQRRYLLRSLEENDWNVSETARRLCVARSHLYSLINSYGLHREQAA